MNRIYSKCIYTELELSLHSTIKLYLLSFDYYVIAPAARMLKPLNLTCLFLYTILLYKREFILYLIDNNYSTSSENAHTPVKFI